MAATRSHEPGHSTGESNCARSLHRSRKDDRMRGINKMRHSRAPHEQPDGEQHYARVEAIILDLQLGISSVSRANGCLDLNTVRTIRARAARTLEHVDAVLVQSQPDTWQKLRVTERRRALMQLLR